MPSWQLKHNVETGLIWGAIDSARSEWVRWHAAHESVVVVKGPWMLSGVDPSGCIEGALALVPARLSATVAHAGAVPWAYPHDTETLTSEVALNVPSVAVIVLVTGSPALLGMPVIDPVCTLSFSPAGSAGSALKVTGPVKPIANSPLVGANRTRRSAVTVKVGGASTGLIETVAVASAEPESLVAETV